MIILFSLLLTVTAANDQGWIPVEAGAPIDFDLLASSLEIKSSSGMGSDKEMGPVVFSSEDPGNRTITYLTVLLTSSPSYQLVPCHTKETEFDVDIPSAETYIWRISLEESQEGARKFLLHCNELELVNVLVNDVCRELPTILNGDVEKITIVENEAAQYYRAFSTPEPTEEIEQTEAPAPTEPKSEEEEGEGEGKEEEEEEEEEDEDKEEEDGVEEDQEEGVAQKEEVQTEQENRSPRTTVLSWITVSFCCLLGVFRGLKLEI